jgi:tRNA(Ile)-lysidine synthase TilS/MesJ
VSDSAFFENTVLQSLGQFTPETVFLAAVSGGSDSVAMFTALLANYKKKTSN